MNRSTADSYWMRLFLSTTFRTDICYVIFTCDHGSNMMYPRIYTGVCCASSCCGYTIHLPIFFTFASLADGQSYYNHCASGVRWEIWERVHNSLDQNLHVYPYAIILLSLPISHIAANGELLYCLWNGRASTNTPRHRGIKLIIPAIHTTRSWWLIDAKKSGVWPNRSMKWPWDTTPTVHYRPTHPPPHFVYGSPFSKDSFKWLFICGRVIFQARFIDIFM